MSEATRKALARIKRMSIKEARRVIARYGPYVTHTPQDARNDYEFVPLEPPVGIERVVLAEAFDKVLNRICKENGK